MCVCVCVCMFVCMCVCVCVCVEVLRMTASIGCNTVQFARHSINILVNTQNVSVTKIVDSSSIQCAESKYGLRIQFLALVVTIHKEWLNV